MALPAAPALPATAYRRTWLFDRVQDLAAAQGMLKLMQALDPARAKRLKLADPRGCYRALLSNVMRRFPLNLWSIMVEVDELESLSWAWSRGIPVAVNGWHWENSSPALDLAVATVAGGFGMESPNDGLSLHEAAGNLDRWVMTWWPGVHAAAPLLHEQSQPYTIRRPRGREWVKPWNGLPDLCLYVQGATRTYYLDTDFETADASPNPDWRLSEIRALEQQYKRAGPMWDHIYSLAVYVDEKPRERLRTLDAALRGDPLVLQTITRPAGRRATLASVFAAKEKRNGRS
ncbi:MAG: hypothetical protein IT318_23905 [Anaerolineales bacterium]|nr:hypothetical protein [Anaerolineales bacterium]